MSPSPGRGDSPEATPPCPPGSDLCSATGTRPLPVAPGVTAPVGCPFPAVPAGATPEGRAGTRGRSGAGGSGQLFAPGLGVPKVGFPGLPPPPPPANSSPGSALAPSPPWAPAQTPPGAIPEPGGARERDLEWPGLAGRGLGRSGGTWKFRKGSGQVWKELELVRKGPGLVWKGPGKDWNGPGLLWRDLERSGKSLSWSGRDLDWLGRDLSWSGRVLDWSGRVLD